MSNNNKAHSFNTNFMIVPGDSIEEPIIPKNYNWTFTDLDFSKVQIVNADSNSSSSSKNTRMSPKKLRNLMNNRDAMIIIYPNKFAGNNKLKRKLSEQAYEKYKDMPCAVISPNKDALISAAIVPFGISSNSNNYYDNGLVFPSGKGFHSNINGGRQAKYYSNSCNWVPSFASNSDQLKTLLSDDELGDTRFGTRQALSPGAGFIDMSSCKSIIYDKQGDTAARKYVASLNGLTRGAAAITYKFVDCDPPKKGSINSPVMLLRLSDKDQSNCVEFAVGPNGKASARVGTDVAIGQIGGGGGSAGGNAVPPQAQAIGGNTVFMYPLYNGFVFSGNAQDGGLFVKYNEFQSYYNMLQITGGSPTDEMKVDWLQNPYSKMQWFPALLQQNTGVPEGLKLKLMQQLQVMQKSNSSSQSGSGGWTIKKNILKNLHLTTPQIEWWCSTGKFSYCPLFFVPEITFDLYFKGQFGGGTDFNYYIYPIVASADANKDAWNIYDNVTKDGANCLSAQLVQKQDISNSQQAIYKVHFSYKTNGNNLPIYPLQIFGCVVATRYEKPRITLKNSNSDFNKHEELKEAKYHDEFNLTPDNGSYEIKYAWMDMITNVSIQSQFQGPTGSITFDEFALRDRDLKHIQIKQCIGQLCLKIQNTEETPFNNKYKNFNYRFTGDTDSKAGDYNDIFRGYALELRNQLSEGGQTVDFTLQGLQKKLEDMKLICAPYWDGDRLQLICRYFEQYCNVKIFMINYNTTSFANRLPVSYGDWTWKADNHRMIGDFYANAPDFRVPRSFEYSKPSVDFPTSTTCLEALNRLAEMTSCALVIQPFGQIDFFELNDMGIPCYVEKQFAKQEQVEQFGPEDVISINISPYLENKYNYFVTFGLLKKRSKKTNKVQGVTVNPGIITTILSNSDSSAISNFPWSRPNVAVENGSLTPSELRYIHANNVMFGISDIYQGDVTVYGNTRIYHLYQAVKICGVKFFVQSISHQIDLSTKTWTTSYGLTYFNAQGPKYDKQKNEFSNSRNAREGDTPPKQKSNSSTTSGNNGNSIGGSNSGYQQITNNPGNNYGTSSNSDN